MNPSNTLCRVCYRERGLLKSSLSHFHCHTFTFTLCRECVTEREVPSSLGEVRRWPRQSGPCSKRGFLSHRWYLVMIRQRLQRSQTIGNWYRQPLLTFPTLTSKDTNTMLKWWFPGCQKVWHPLPNVCAVRQPRPQHAWTNPAWCLWDATQGNNPQVMQRPVSKMWRKS